MKTKAKKPFSKRKLTNDLEASLSALKQHCRRIGLLEIYELLVADSAYLRVFEREGVERKTLSEDSLTLLLVAFAKRTCAGKHDIFPRLAGQTFGLVQSQFKFLHSKVDEKSWLLACEAAKTSTLLADRNEIDFVEQLLISINKTSRKELGAFYTSRSLADQVVEKTISKIKSLELEPEMDSNRANHLHELTVLDPAAGCGVFLLAYLDQVSVHSKTANDIEPFSDFVPNQIANRCIAIEIHPAVACVCAAGIADWFRATSQSEPKIKVYCGDALEMIAALQSSLEGRGLLAVIGNPPFGALSTNMNSSMAELLAGKRDGISYFEVDGERISERKIWLHDDYVKFFRLAHFLVSHVERGVIAFISNRSFIDNLTFRGMRWQLMQTFHEIEVNELSDDHFSINASVCASYFLTANATRNSTVVTQAGQGSSKAFSPQGPNYFFSQRCEFKCERYENALSITEAMPFSGSAAITARDWFATAFTRQELIDRIEEFCDLSIGDSVIREKYFVHSRSRRYAPGDTRSWKMAEARRRLSECNWEALIRRCSYRPFDQRWILWSPHVVDWPRSKLMDQFEIEGNVALITRRQFPHDQPACYFWATDQITIDGILRSDNRGNESLFPLWVRNEVGQKKANFSNAFMDQMRSRFGELFGQLEDSQAAETLFYYIVGLYHSPVFRQRYRDAINIDFPRVLVVEDEGSVQTLIELGKTILGTQLQSGLEETEAGEVMGTVGPPEFCNGKIRLNGHVVTETTEEAWAFRAGSHHVIRKWLKVRKGQPLTEGILSQLSTVVEKVEKLSKLCHALKDVTI